MSREQLDHIAEGRAPWSRWIQLRAVPSPKAAPHGDSESLVSAAANTAPPNLVRASVWHGHEAKRRLIQLCEWLNDRLNRPTCVDNTDPLKRYITVFETLCYEIDFRQCRVSVGTDMGSEFRWENHVFELGRPLSTAFWLSPIIRKLGLGNAQQTELFIDSFQADLIEIWIASTAYQLLRKDARFRRLREVILPSQIGLPADIFGIAMASRITPRGPLVASTVVNQVWHNAKQFRQVAREAPQLLPLFMAYLRFSGPDTNFPKPDPVQTLKSAMRERGISEASWRYVVRHGSRLFRPVWEATRGQPAFEAALEYLKLLQMVRLPAPASADIVKSLIHAFSPHEGNFARLNATSFAQHHEIEVLRLGLLELDRRRKQDALRGFMTELLETCIWASDNFVFLDHNQIKAGWSCIRRLKGSSEALDAKVYEMDKRAWRNRLRTFSMLGCDVVPLESSVELANEARVMHNCLQNFIDDCCKGEFEVYSIRLSGSERRIGCAGFGFYDGIAILYDAKGIANTPAPWKVDRIAAELELRLQSFESV